MNNKLRLVMCIALLMRLLVWGLTVVKGPDTGRCADDYLGLAAAWSASGFFPTHALYFPPAYPMICRAIQLLCGENAIYGVQLLQTCMGVLSVYMIYLITQRAIKSERTAVIAAWIAALDPLLLIYTPLILTETLYTTLLVCLTCQMVYLDGGSRRDGVILGLLIGLCLLSRSVGLVLWPILVGYWWIRKYRWRNLAIATAVSFLLCMPVMMENYLRYDRFQVTASGKYNISALWIGQAKAAIDGRDYGANLTMWGIADSDDASTFAQADRAFPLALRWAEQHPKALVAAVSRGIRNLILGPGTAYYDRIIGWGAPVYYRLGAVYRLVIFVGTIAGFLILFAANRPMGLLLGGLLFVHTVAPGAAGYSRFAVPGETFEIILCGIAVGKAVQALQGRLAREDPLEWI